MRTENEISAIRDGLIEAFGRSVGVWGMNETLGRMFGLLYFADEPLSLDEMAKDLMVSKATISINIRILENTKLAQKVWQKGTRKDYYVAERDFEKIVQEFLRTNAMDELKIHKEAMTQAIAGYEKIIHGDFGPELKAGAKGDLEKIYELARWMQTGEKWLFFLIDSDINESPKGDLKRIEVEWEDER